MRTNLRFAVALVTCLAAPAAFIWSGAATAQPKDDAGGQEPKEVTLTQKQIDGAIAAQQDIKAIEAKLPQGSDKPDPNIEAKLDAVAKKNGFANLAEYEDVSATIAIVMSGMDPESKTYVGPATMIKKQIAEVKADTKMPPNDKKAALDELQGALSSAGSTKPTAANVDLVSKNLDKLSQGLRPEDE